VNDLLADYSPDGQHIAYMTNHSIGDNSGEIWVMSADGTNHRQLTNNDRYDFQPIWSPNGQYIAFTGMSPETAYDIFVYDFLTDQIHQLTTLPTRDASPVWSPDSQWIAFVSYTSDGQQSQIYVIRPDGRSLRPVVDEHRGYGLLLWMDENTKE
jgi:TolB protein